MTEDVIWEDKGTTETGTVATPPEGTAVAGNVMVSMRSNDGGTASDYDVAIFHATNTGMVSIEYAMSGHVEGLPADGDGRSVTLAAALPDGMADMALFVSERGCVLEDASEDEIATALGYSLTSTLGVALHRAKILTAGHEPNSIGYGSYVPDADGREISIGSWIRQWDDAPVHRVVGIGVNRFHGPMVMVDDAVTGEWLCITRRTRVVDGISDWEGLIDAAERKLLPKSELVRMARILATQDEE